MPQVPTPPPAPTPAAPQSAESMLAAMRAMRDAANRQLEQLTQQREQLIGELRGAGSATEQASLSRRLESIDQRIIESEQQLASLEMETARLAAEARITQPSRPIPPFSYPRSSQMPGVIGVVFTVLVLFPMAIAYSRRIWRRAAGIPTEAKLPPEVAARLERLEAGVDTIAVEVERISEGQRFVTKLLSGDGAKAAIPRSATER